MNICIFLVSKTLNNNILYTLHRATHLFLFPVAPMNNSSSSAITKENLLHGVVSSTYYCNDMVKYIDPIKRRAETGTVTHCT